MSSRTHLLRKIFDLEIVKFGDFTLKSGLKSPFYVDLRAIASMPDLLRELSNELLSTCKDVHYDLICGVPYAALPLATAMSLESGTPLIIKRKESKGYGTDKLIEGVYRQGQPSLVVEDVITSGKSLLETIPELESSGLMVKDIAIVIDRQQGGRQLLEAKGYRVHVLFSISEIIDYLHEHGYVDAGTKEAVMAFLSDNAHTPTIPKRRGLAEKKALIEHPVSKRLLDIAIAKKSNLVCSADLTTVASVLDLAEKVAPYIVALKIHADIIEDFDAEFIKRLRHLADAHRFLIFEDRKFADIGNTAVMQLTKGVHHIAHWADMVTAHVTAGAGSILALKNAAPEVAIIPIVQMSTEDTLTDSKYAKRALDICNKHRDAVIGVVAQSISVRDHFLKFTPGINFSTSGDDKGQQYNSPEVAFNQYLTDFIIVGRGIYQADDPALAAKNYQEKARAAIVIG